MIKIASSPDYSPKAETKTYQKPQIILDDIIDKKSNYTEAVKAALLHQRVSIVGYNPLFEEKFSKKKKKRSIRLKNINEIAKSVTICHCCGRFPRKYLDVNFNRSELGFLGQGYALYFTFQILCIFLLITLYLLVISNAMTYKWLAKKVGRRKLTTLIDEADLVCICVTVLCEIIILGFSYYMRVLAIKVDQNDTSPEDYSVLVKNIPIEIVKAKNEGTVEPISIEKELKHFFETCFKTPIEVNTVCMCYNLVPLACIQNHKQRFIQIFKDTCQSKIIEQIEKIVFPLKQTRPLYLDYYGVQPTTESRVKLKLYDKIAFCKQKINMLNKRMDDGYRDNQLLFIGQAIISFESQQMSSFILNGSEDKPPPRAYFFGNQLCLSKPEHPKGIYWHNLHLTSTDYKVRNIFSVISCSAIFLCSIFLQVIINYLKFRYNSKVFDHLSSLMINVINMLIPMFILKFFSTFEGHRTRTDEIMSFVKKSFLLQAMNTLMVPLVVVFMFNRTEKIYFQSQNGVMFRNAIFPVIQLMFSFKLIHKEFLIWSYSQGFTFWGLVPKHLTFKEFFEIHEFPPFQIQARASDILKTMILSFFLGFQVKRVVLYSILSFYFSYWMDKYNLTRRRVVKSHVNETLNYYMMSISHLSVSAFLLCQLYLYPSTLKGLLFFVSVFFYYKPMIKYVVSSYKKNQIGKNQTFSTCKEKIFETDYKRENPATRGYEQKNFVSHIRSRNTSVLSRLGNVNMQSQHRY